jgi:biotin operon repressor
MANLILWAIIESLRADGYEVTEIKGGEQIAGGM